MKACNYCYECLQKLVFQAADLATKDEPIRAKAVEEGLKILHDDFSLDCVSIVVATKMHDVIKKITGNPDPYRPMKDKEIAVARELSQQIKVKDDDFISCLKFAALGNTMDFFRPLDVIQRAMKEPVNFVIDDSKSFEAKLKQGSRVLYLADNAGEVFFDLPLITWMRR
ncbi:MAG: ARMT1-like domain-containing protein, partial [Dehalococcoidia bacterium]|nr:ARMT1-like domain-containing protein [Dehalococcoidia bacterium]